MSMVSTLKSKKIKFSLICLINSILIVSKFHQGFLWVLFWIAQLYNFISKIFYNLLMVVNHAGIEYKI